MTIVFVGDLRVGVETELHPQAAVITANHDPINEEHTSNALTNYPSFACFGIAFR